MPSFKIRIRAPDAEPPEGGSALERFRAQQAARKEQAQQQAPPSPVERDGPVVRLRIIQPKEPPQLLVPPPSPRPVEGAPLRQRTVLDYKPDGTPYIRGYIEGSGITRPGDPVYERARASTTVFCSRKLHFQVALSCCYRYCDAPCQDHIEAISTVGWVKQEQYVTSARRAEMATAKENQKRKKDERDDEDG